MIERVNRVADRRNGPTHADRVVTRLERRQLCVESIVNRDEYSGRESEDILIRCRQCERISTRAALNQVVPLFAIDSDNQDVSAINRLSAEFKLLLDRFAGVRNADGAAIAAKKTYCQPVSCTSNQPEGRGWRNKEARSSHSGQYRNSHP